MAKSDVRSAIFQSGSTVMDCRILSWMTNQKLRLLRTIPGACITHDAQCPLRPKEQHGYGCPHGGDGCPHLRASLAPTLRFPLCTSLLPASHLPPYSPDFAAGPTSNVADRVELPAQRGYQDLLMLRTAAGPFENKTNKQDFCNRGIGQISDCMDCASRRALAAELEQKHSVGGACHPGRPHVSGRGH